MSALASGGSLAAETASAAGNEAVLRADLGDGTRSKGLFAARPRLLLATLLVLLVLATGIRLYRIDSPFPGLLVDREYIGALVARAEYFQNAESVLEWRRQAAFVAAASEPVLEPRVMELLTANTYRLLGGEHLWVGRLYSSAFWLAGGIFLFFIARRLVSADAGILSTAYYLFVPLGLSASGSIQPDSLMIMLFLLSVLLLLRYNDQPSMLRLVLAASCSGVTLFIRPLVLFVLLAVFLVIEVRRRGGWRRLVGSNFVTFVLVSFAPMAAFYGHAIVIDGYLSWKVGTSFEPHLFLAKEYWRNWLTIGSNQVGPVALATALVGITLARRGCSRMLLGGLWVGYLVFGLVFNHHIHTHHYYHLQLIPIVALSMGPTLTLISENLSLVCSDWRWWAPPALALLLIGALTLIEARTGLEHRNYERPKTAWEIGEIVNHSTNVAFLSPFYGRPLMYFGELAGNYWPRSVTSGLYAIPGDREKTVQERWDALGTPPDYFIITDFPEYEAHHADLKAFLEGNCPLLATTSRYIVYGACTN